ncbi:MAG TPA: hypothetical protein VET89_10125 [Stellaceae bacterium]|nr:hypothetical protein [Stellaceae bacterium]
MLAVPAEVGADAGGFDRSPLHRPSSKIPYRWFKGPPTLPRPRLRFALDLRFALESHGLAGLLRLNTNVSVERNRQCAG